MSLKVITGVTLTLALSLLASSALAEEKVAPSSAPDKVDTSSAKPEVFFKKVYQSCKSEKSDTWKPLLSRERREKGADYIEQHYKIWCSFITPLVQNKFGGDAGSAKMKFKLDLDPKSNRGKMTLNDEKGKKLLPMSVVLEGGELKIDEN